MLQKHLVPIVALVLVVCLPMLTGCGGGGGTSQSQSSTPVAADKSGSLQFNIVWPTPGRVIPSAAQSLVITLVSNNGIQLQKKVVARPTAGVNTSSVRFDALAPGTITVTVAAFPTTDGTGIAQAIASETVTIIPGVTTQANIDPLSTVDHLDVSPATVALIPGQATLLIVSPRDAQNNLVLVAPSSLSFTVGTPGIVSVNSAGLITGVALGSTTVQVVDTESGKTNTVPVNVVPPIVVTPPTATITIGDTLSLTATVTGLASTGLTWSASSGTIDQQGNFTAPNAAGTVLITATSVSNPGTQATATVIVQAGSGTINIQ